MAAVLEIQNIRKAFGGVQALRDVSFSMERGQRHALLGENGAGKSTLVRILSGEHLADAGTIRLGGELLRVRSPAEARAAGVALVPQELSYCPNLSVAENLLLGETPSRLGLVRRAEQRAEAERRLRRLGLIDIHPDWPMSRLSTGQAQAAQIAAAVARHPKLLLLDEPTSALSRGEARQLAQTLRQLKEEAVSVLYVSHRMEEIFGSADSGFVPCDAYTVLRDGQHVRTAPLAGETPQGVVRAMIGRELTLERLPHLDRPIDPGAAVRLHVHALTDPQHERFENISFWIRSGEVLGLAGLVGAGRTEVARALVGLDRGATGRVELDGKPFTPRGVQESLRAGLVYLTEDRKREGLVLGMGCAGNWSLPFVSRFRQFGAWLSRSRERAGARDAFESLRVKTASLDAPVRNLSGGNQQKILFARWLSVEPKPGVVILDEPTRGVDVGAKAEIHRLIGALAAGGTAVLVISSDLPELLAVCTRVGVLHEGRWVGELSGREIQEEPLGRMLVGV